MQDFKGKKAIMSNNSSAKRAVFIFLFISYLAVLSYLYFGKISRSSLLPDKIFGFEIDKVVHFIMFFPYPFLAHGSFTGKRKWRNLLFIFFFGIVLAYSFELSQDKIVSYRTTDPWDLIFNVASLTIATFILAVIDLFRK